SYGFSVIQDFALWKVRTRFWNFDWLNLIKILSPMVAALTWRMLLNVRFGPYNYIPLKLNLIAESIGWLVNAKMALWGLMAIDIWQSTPFIFLIIYAGLLCIPTPLIESARMDGASDWDVLLHITVPIVKPFVLIAILIRTIDSFKTFDYIQVLTKGGPGSATTTLTYLGYLLGFRH
ncbi:unnamed protein product, partial [marine sediment metagenome]